MLDEVDHEIERAKGNERKVKEFARNNVNGIIKQVQEEIRKVEMATDDVKKLKSKVEKNRKNMEWLSAFEKEMRELLDV